MSIGLIALIDDVAAIAKVAAASLDDLAGQAVKAGAKAAGVVIDDAAVTPRYVVGFAAERELAIVGKIAAGSLRNKLLVLLPGALALSFFAPSAVTPLLMIGGAYLCYEGTEKVFEVVVPHRSHAHEAQLASIAVNAETLEDEQVASAVKTDFILSAEIMAIALAAVPEADFWTQAIVLALVGIGITAAVYGGVAVIVKADDIGVALAAVTSDSLAGKCARGLGRALVLGMPVFLQTLSIVGTAAMIWVGGGIIVHGLEAYGFAGIAHAIHGVSDAAHELLPAAGIAQWIASAAGAGLFGLVVGAMLIPVTGYVISPAWKRLKLLRRRPEVV
jgi:predicted DNA repair protein MutK